MFFKDIYIYSICSPGRYGPLHPALVLIRGQNGLWGQVDHQRSRVLCRPLLVPIRHDVLNFNTFYHRKRNVRLKEINVTGLEQN